MSEVTEETVLNLLKLKNDITNDVWMTVIEIREEMKTPKSSKIYVILTRLEDKGLVERRYRAQSDEQKAQKQLQQEEWHPTQNEEEVYHDR